MARCGRPIHKDVEFGVGNEVFKTFEEAAAYALSTAIARGEVALDVLIYSRAGANAYGGDDAQMEYQEDPDGVFERFVVRVSAVGKVP